MKRENDKNSVRVLSYKYTIEVRAARQAVIIGVGSVGTHSFGVIWV